MTAGSDDDNDFEVSGEDIARVQKVKRGAKEEL